MRLVAFSFIIFSALMAGIFFAAYQNEWIIFQLPAAARQTYFSARIQKKMVTIVLYKNDEWYTEKKERIWPAAKAEKIEHLLHAWQLLIDEDLPAAKQSSVQLVMLNKTENDLYVSFDRSPLLKEWSIMRKWYHIESLLKTVRANGIELRSVYFLVQHQPLEDAHLDFSNGWPSQGFINE
jgi:hypothetical protein